ncbi:MAG: ATP-binding protein [Candidatus Omnitrophica bacterium]|nr:ATP-binding protein [Candidatus Omnitrophota bacterium]
MFGITNSTRITAYFDHRGISKKIESIPEKNMIPLYGISNLLIALTSCAIAILVFFHGARNKTNRIWVPLAFSIAIYGFGAYMVSLSKTAEKAFFWWQIAYIGIIMIPVFFYHFVCSYLGLKRPKSIRVMYILSISYLILCWVRRDIFLGGVTLFFKDSKIFAPGYWIYPSSPFLKAFIVFGFLGTAIISHIDMFRGYQKANSLLVRNQIKYFVVGTLTGFIGGGTSFLPCFNISFYPVLNICVVIYPIITSYTIFRYRLMELSIVITRTTIFIAVYSLLLGLPVAIGIGLREWLISILGNNWWVVPSGLITVAATTGPFIYVYFQRKAEERLLKEQRRYQEVLKRAAQGMPRIRNLSQLLNFCVEIIIENVRISHAAIYLFDNKRGQFLLKENRNLPKKLPGYIKENNDLISWLKNYPEPLVYEEVKRRAEDTRQTTFNRLEHHMRALSASLIVPAFLEDNLIGILLLGSKRSGQTYTPEDLNIFSVISSQLAMAIENAQLYENIEAEVKKRTQELVDVQKQLVQAEKLATMGTLAGGVAHEINNPLTAILTNTQMLLATKEYDLESLQMIEEAAKRCKNIVQKLMTYAKKPLDTNPDSIVDMRKVLQTSISFLKFQLEQENIEITVDISSEGKYLLKGNSNELEQVITNLLLNAKDAIKKIRKNGKIIVELSETDNMVKLAIKDDGVGIPQGILSKIFDPFFTTKEIGKGLGLGLSICQAIIDKHNGKILVDTEINKGSTFTVLIPRLKQVNPLSSQTTFG